MTGPAQLAAMAMCTQGIILLIVRNFRRKETFIKFDHTADLIFRIPFTHSLSFYQQCCVHPQRGQTETKVQTGCGELLLKLIFRLGKELIIH